MALSNILSYFNAENTVGKEMKDKKRKDGQPVTPDIVSEFPKDSELREYAILSESKTSFPREKEHWKKDADQLKRYDAEFENWTTEVKNHDIILITDVMRVSEFWGYLQNLADKDGNYKFNHNLAVFSYTRDTKNSNILMVIRKELGELSKSNINKKLLLNRVPLKNFFREVEATKFYDRKPEVIYTMEILWDFIFSKGIAEEDYRKYPMNRPIPIKVNTDNIRKEVNERFSPRTNQNLVRRAWIKEALDKFVELKLAERLDKDGNDYKIFFRKRGKKKLTRNFLLDLAYGEDEVVPDGQTTIESF